MGEKEQAAAEKYAAHMIEIARDEAAQRARNDAALRLAAGRANAIQSEISHAEALQILREVRERLGYDDHEDLRQMPGCAETARIGCDMLRERVQDLAAENGQLKEALAFYAHPATWESDGGRRSSLASRDVGLRANAALRRRKT